MDHIPTTTARRQRPTRSRARPGVLECDEFEDLVLALRREPTPLQAAIAEFREHLDTNPSAPSPLPDLVAGALHALPPPPREASTRFVAPVPVDPRGIDGPTPRQARGPRWRRVARNRYVPTHCDTPQPAQRIADAAALLPDFGGVTGWASLHLAGARYFDGGSGDHQRPVALQVGPLRERRDAGAGVEIRRATIARSEIVDQQGIRCLTPERSLLDEILPMRSPRRIAATVEMAAHAELTSASRFRDYVVRHPAKTGIYRVRAGVLLCRDGAESPPEVATRLIWTLDAGLPEPLCNPDIYSLDGRFLARVDLLDPVAGVVGEYDGEHHLSAAQRRRDIGREELLREHGLEYFTVVAGDLIDRTRLAARMQRVRRRALSTVAPRRWTLTQHTDGIPSARSLTLDERLDLRDLLLTMRSTGREDAA